jgi:hypothetical protein
MATVRPDEMFTSQTPEVLAQDKGQDLRRRVSRCRVCVRPPKTSRPQPHPGFWQDVTAPKTQGAANAGPLLRQAGFQ